MIEQMVENSFNTISGIQNACSMIAAQKRFRETKEPLIMNKYFKAILGKKATEEAMNLIETAALQKKILNSSNSGSRNASVEPISTKNELVKIANTLEQNRRPKGEVVSETVFDEKEGNKNFASLLNDIYSEAAKK